MLTIFKKELARFFGDKRMAITTILLPGLLIYVLYSFMGSAIMNNFSADESAAPVVAVIALPDSVEPLLSQATMLDTTRSAEEAKQAVTEQSVDALLIFPEDFDAAVAAYQTGSGAAPNIELYYNSASGSAAYTLLTGLLGEYESALANKFDINAGGKTYDLASEEDTTGSIFSMMLPMLLMIFLFSGCMAVAPESIAGEKERGTITTLLITPVSRSHIALGKIGALSLIALLSGAGSALGTILSMPKLMAGAGEISGSLYTINDYLLLSAVLISTVLLLVTLISIISALAKTVKEAQTMVTPLMILVMFLGVTSMFGSGASTSPFAYLIPLYNSVQAMSAILSFDASLLHLLLTVAANVVYAAAGVWVLTRLFRSERVLFAK